MVLVGASDGFYRELVELSAVAIVVVGPDAVIRYQSSGAAELLGQPGRRLEGQLLPSLFTPDTAERVDAYLRSLTTPSTTRRFTTACCATDTGLLWVEMTGVSLLDVSEVAGIAVSLADRTEQHLREQELADLARHDPLTGLPNRAVVTEALRDLDAAPHVVAMVDIDGFQRFNDACGHEAGDALLAAAADRIRAAVPLDVLVARMSGDEFVLVLPGSIDEATPLLEDVLAAVRRTPVDEDSLTVSVSMGVAAGSAADGMGVLRHAEVAMYQAKESGQDRFQIYDPDSQDWARRRKEEHVQLERLRARVRTLELESRTDALTGIPNARGYLEELEALDAETRRSGRPLGVIFFDLDDFHALNRARTDVAGDATLREVASILAAGCRRRDRVYRKGGEEFVVLLPDTDLEAAVGAAERLRAAVEAAGIPHGAAPGRPVVTITGGVAVLDPARPVTRSDVIADASAAMSRAKIAGKNRVERAPTPAAV